MNYAICILIFYTCVLMVCYYLIFIYSLTPNAYFYDILNILILIFRLKNIYWSGCFAFSGS